MSSHIRLRIDEGRLMELTCPCFGEDDCEAYASRPEVETWLDGESLDRWHRLSQMRMNRNLRECPRCHLLCQPLQRPQGSRTGSSTLRTSSLGRTPRVSDVSRPSAMSAEDSSPSAASDGVLPETGADDVLPEMVCSACGLEFCYFHSNAHPPGSSACAVYTRTQIRLDRLMASTSGSKPCPSCGVATQKIAGCNHMTCTCCRVHWCWQCGRQLGNIGWHYNPGNPAGCMQFVAAEVPLGIDCMMVFFKLLALPCILISSIFGVLMVVAFVLGFFIGLPLVPVLCKATQIPFVLGSLVAAVLAMPFLWFDQLWTVLAVLIWLVFVPVGARLRHLEFFKGAAFATVTAVAMTMLHGPCPCDLNLLGRLAGAFGGRRQRRQGLLRQQAASGASSENQPQVASGAPA